jgi:hypothetical protein
MESGWTIRRERGWRRRLNSPPRRACSSREHGLSSESPDHGLTFGPRSHSVAQSASEEGVCASRFPGVVRLIGAEVSD